MLPLHHLRSRLTVSPAATPTVGSNLVATTRHHQFPASHRQHKKVGVYSQNLGDKNNLRFALSSLFTSGVIEVRPSRESHKPMRCCQTHHGCTGPLPAASSGLEFEYRCPRASLSSSRRIALFWLWIGKKPLRLVDPQTSKIFLPAIIRLFGHTDFFDGFCHRLAPSNLNLYFSKFRIICSAVSRLPRGSTAFPWLRPHEDSRSKCGFV